MVTSELPGVTPGDVTINLQEDVLTLDGARRPKQEQGGNWQRYERTYGSFSRTVQLPFRVDPDKVQAHFNNGILEIELQRLEADRPKKSRSATADLSGRNAIMPQEMRTVDQQVPKRSRGISAPPLGRCSCRPPTFTKLAIASLCSPRCRVSLPTGWTSPSSVGC